MKTHMNTKLVVGSILTLILALLMWSPALQSAEHPDHPAGKAATKSCQAMQVQKLEMMEHLQAQDAELAKQVARMNRAPADKKVDLMAAILTQMVKQRSVMHTRQAKMHEGMMQHMAQHIQMGKESLAQCKLVAGTDKRPSRRREHPDHPKKR